MSSEWQWIVIRQGIYLSHEEIQRVKKRESCNLLVMHKKKPCYFKIWISPKAEKADQSMASISKCYFMHLRFHCFLAEPQQMPEHDCTELFVHQLKGAAIVHPDLETDCLYHVALSGTFHWKRKKKVILNL